jgi:hypothetical protein
MKRNHRSPALLVILILVGLIIGGLFGELLGTYVPAVALSKDIGFSTTNINVGVMTMALGLNIDLNLGGVLGMIIAILLYREM